ncbi:MAG: hypothetical protein HY071_01065 [Chloroflexi bacterium]|nr:hypothetical protein [Chloroflexota bacterium]
MPFDPGHLWARLFDPFNSESRFYWPFVIGLGITLVANIVWYAWPQDRDSAPAEHALRPWAFWINVVILIWVLVLVIAKAPFFWTGVTFAIDLGILGSIYLYVLPPRELEWLREQRRQKYIPKAKKKRRR